MKNQKGNFALVIISGIMVVAGLLLGHLEARQNKFFLTEEKDIKDKYLNNAAELLESFYYQNAALIDGYEIPANSLYPGSPYVINPGTLTSNSVDPRTQALQRLFNEYSPVQLKYGLKIRVSDQECNLGAGLLTNTTVCSRQIAIYYDDDERIIKNANGEYVAFDGGNQITSYFTKPIVISGKVQAVNFYPKSSVSNYRVINGAIVQRQLLGKTIDIMKKLAIDIENFGRSQFLMDPLHDVNVNYFKAASCGAPLRYELGCTYGFSELNTTNINALKLNMFGYTENKLKTAWGTPLYINNDNGNPSHQYNALTVAETNFSPYTVSIMADMPWFKPVIGASRDGNNAGTGIYFKATQQIS